MAVNPISQSSNGCNVTVGLGGEVVDGNGLGVSVGEGFGVAVAVAVGNGWVAVMVGDPIVSVS